MNNVEINKCQNCHKDFVIEPEDFAFYAKIKVPPPTWCSRCRLQRRLVFRNERSLYKRKCDFSGKEIFSMFSKNAPVKVYDIDIWWSDKWDPMEYRRDYDFNKTFFEQYFNFIKDVPRFSRSVLNIINSDYCMNAGELKNCYLLFHADFDENCMYGSGITNSNDCVDNAYIKKCELCYGCFMNNNCYKAFFSSYCDNSHEIYFCYNCIGCSNCVGCVNLRNKQYHIFNKPYSKNEYQRKLKEFNLGSYQVLNELTNKMRDFKLKFPVKFMTGRQNINVTGEYIFNSKNVFDSYRVYNGENSRYLYLMTLGPVKDCYDYNNWGNNAELIYESNQVGINVSHLKFCVWCYSHCSNLEYCIMCSSSNLFGCIGLRNKQYCIFNKQYTKEEYEKLVPKIIQHMNDMPYIDKRGRVYKYGEFFPPELSPFAYNETIAQEYFPLTKEQAIEQGYSWKEPEERDIKIDIKSEQLPDHIKDVSDDIIGKTIQCSHAKIDRDRVSVSCNEQCTTAFKIIEPELQFYRRMNLPLPRLCPNCRHYQRIKQRNPLKLWHRKCMCGGQTSANGVYKNTIKHFHDTEPCPNEFETTYASERPEIVYCEQCYLAEVV